MSFLESNFMGLYLIFYKEFENCFLMFTSFRKREIKQLRRGRATTAKKCTKKCAAHAE